MTYVISDQKNPTKFPSYTFDDLRTFLLSHQDPPKKQTELMIDAKETIFRHLQAMGIVLRWCLY